MPTEEQYRAAGRLTNPNAPELAPCPFCGGGGDHTWDHNDRPIIQCDECGTATAWRVTHKAAAKAWNTRAGTKLIREALEEAQSYVEGWSYLSPESSKAMKPTNDIIRRALVHVGDREAMAEQEGGGHPKPFDGGKGTWEARKATAKEQSPRTEEE